MNESIAAYALLLNPRAPAATHIPGVLKCVVWWPHNQCSAAIAQKKWSAWLCTSPFIPATDREQLGAQIDTLDNKLSALRHDAVNQPLTLLSEVQTPPAGVLLLNTSRPPADEGPATSVKCRDVHI
jgi:hypothetical protein